MVLPAEVAGRRHQWSGRHRSGSTCRGRRRRRWALPCWLPAARVRVHPMHRSPTLPRSSWSRRAVAAAASARARPCSPARGGAALEDSGDELTGRRPDLLGPADETRGVHSACVAMGARAEPVAGSPAAAAGGSRGRHCRRPARRPSVVVSVVEPDCGAQGDHDARDPVVGFVGVAHRGLPHDRDRAPCVRDNRSAIAIGRVPSRSPGTCAPTPGAVFVRTVRAQAGQPGTVNPRQPLHRREARAGSPTRQRSSRVESEHVAVIRRGDSHDGRRRVLEAMRATPGLHPMHRHAPALAVDTLPANRVRP